MRYYMVPQPLIDTRFLSENDDKLMNRLILEGHALVLESDPMFSSDDSYCGCNCGCCFNAQAVGKSEDVCSKECGCDCSCCKETKRKQTQYWVDKNGCSSVAKELLSEKTKLNKKELEEYMNMNFQELWNYFDVNKTGLVEIERMSQFYKMFLKDFKIDI